MTIHQRVRIVFFAKFDPNIKALPVYYNPLWSFDPKLIPNG